MFSFDPDAAGAQAVPPRFDRERGDLAVVDIATGRVDTLAVGWGMRGWRIAPDGGAVAVLRMAEAAVELQRIYFDLVVLPLDGSEPRAVATCVPQRYGISFNWSPDSRHLAYTTAERGRPGRLFVVAADGGGAPLQLSDEAVSTLAQEYEAPRWSDDGCFIYCLARDGVWEFAADGSGRRRIAPPGGRTPIGWTQPPASATLWRSADDALLQITVDLRTKALGLARTEPADDRGTLLVELPRSWSDRAFGVEATPGGSAVYLALEAADRPPEIWQFGDDFRTPRRVYAFNPALDGVALGASRLARWRALDGEERRGALLLPPDYTEGRRIPLVVDIYRGRLGSDRLHHFGGDIGLGNGQLLAGHGIGVLYPDLPLTDRDPLHQLPGQVLPAVNRLIELGIADPNRLGLMGHSFGGYCTVALLTQTTRFKAAAASAAMINLTSFYGILTGDGDTQWLGWAESGQGRLGGSLWERREAYIENSPLFSLDRVRTPLLLVSGTAHPGEAAQAGEAFSALRRLGQRVELRLYQGEEHWPGVWSERSFRDLSERLLQWFATHLQT